MNGLLLLLVVLMAISSVACGTEGPGANQTAPTVAPRGLKTLTMGLTIPVSTLGGAGITIRGGLGQTPGIHTNSLVAVDQTGYIEPRLAPQLPSLRDGTLVVHPEGTMEVTWKLRANVKWHDGQPFTVDDVVFGASVYLDRDLGIVRGPTAALIDRVEAIDANTARIYWKTTYYQPLAMGTSQLAPLPVHLLKDSYAGDKERFLVHSYWTTDYVHLGPFRLADFGMGERLIFERFDAYFLGGPQVDRVILQAIGDANTLYANLLAGAIDVAAGQTLSADQAIDLQRDWKQTGAGRILTRMTTLEFLSLQHHPERVAPPEIAREFRLREGLFRGIDRPTMAEAFYPGFDTVAETFMQPTDARNAIIGKPYAAYRYDREGALRTLAGAGWIQDAGGRLVRQNGDRVGLTVRADAGRTTRLAILADTWRQLGLTVNEEITAPAQIQNREYRASYSFVEWSSRGAGEPLLDIFTTRTIPTPQNSWNGTNYASYSNSAYDRLVERILVSVEEGQQANLLKDVGAIFTTEWPFLPLQYGVVFTSLRRGIHTVGDGNDDSWEDWNAHRWAKDL